MRRLAGHILIVVAIFVVAVMGILISRSRAVRVESVGAPSVKADLRIKEVQVEEESGGVRWRLNAEQALVFENEGRTQLRKIDLKVTERNRSWTVVGEEGDFERETKNLEVRRKAEEHAPSLTREFVEPPRLDELPQGRDCGIE